MRAYLLVLTIFATLSSGLACGGEAEVSTPVPSLSPTLSVTPSSSPEVTATPATTVSSSDALDTSSRPGLVYVRGGTDESWAPFTYGVLWLSDLQGEEQVQITPEGIDAVFAGVAPDPQSEHLVVYYGTLEGEAESAIWRRNLETGETALVIEYENGGREWLVGGSVSPDGRYLAYGHADGVDVLDLVTGESWRVVTSNWAECWGASPDCINYSTPVWSPDGALLLIRKTFWEGGTEIVVDPFADPPQVLTPDSADMRFEPFTAKWAPSGQAICGYGRYGENSGLYVAQALGWEWERVLTEYQTPSGRHGTVDRSVEGCAWVDSSYVAIIVHVMGWPEQDFSLADESMEVAVYELSTAEVRVVATIEEESQAWASVLLASSEEDVLVVQHQSDLDGWYPPELIDLQSGARAPVLSASDRLVGLVE